MINCDLYDKDADYKIDARDLSHLKDETVDSIYSSNLLEHFTILESRNVLQEWNRVLKKGGYLVLSVPDMKKIIDTSHEWLNADWLDIPPPKLWDSIMKTIFGWQHVGPGQIHQWGYSPKYLAHRLEKNGFEVKELYSGYPNRPTPNFTVIAVKIKKEDKENE